ncbi:MAG: 30S ribosomal protein S12 methylthiotransferase RimO [Armatimonadetes bacterium]|nr:30S ribosomal protein S12 methylthiotransferase RimO [Armatimonadota bacterium]
MNCSATMEQDKALSGVKVALIRLGCPKNDVDAEYMLGLLERAGCEVVRHPEAADVVIVNTCSFIRPACDEAIETLLEAADLKTQGVRAVVCAGCLPARYGTELVAELAEIDGFLAPGAIEQVAKVVAAALRGDRPVALGSRGAFPQAGWPRHKLDPPWRATIKIADGCSHACTFCTIPFIRGRYKSQPVAALVGEVEAALTAGATEICLVAQDTSSYGLDLGLQDGLVALLESLSPLVTTERWLRVQYLHPDRLTPNLIAALLRLPGVVSYFDLPFQHGSARILSAMGRQGNRKSYTRLVEAIREQNPDAAIRATFIVGFPGETDEDFHELLGFVGDIEPDHVAVFPYYAEEGTRAARMPGRVPQPELRRRLEEFTDTAHSVAHRRGERLVGRRLQVLVEEHTGGGQYAGRTFRDAPDIDGVFYLLGRRRLAPGNFVQAVVTGAEVSDLFGQQSCPQQGL